jgi:hypothetical protein
MPGVCLSRAFPGVAEGLTGVAATDKVDGLEFEPGDFFDVAILGNLRPVLR